MPFLSKLYRAATRPPVVTVVFLLACGFCSWRIWEYRRGAPVREHIDQGVALLQKGDAASAERELQAAARLDPNNVQAWELLGDLYVLTHNYKTAMESFVWVYRLDPNTPDLQGKMAKAAYAMGDMDPAREFAEAQLAQNPNNTDALQVLGTLEKAAGQSEQAIKHLRQAIALQPNNLGALNTLADELEARDRYNEIIPVADKIINLSPKDANGYLRKGIAVYVSNLDADSPQKAKDILLKALELDPQNVDAHRFLGRAYLRLNQPREAITQFEAVGRGRPYATAHLLELSLAYRRLGNLQMADQLRARFTFLKELNTRWVGWRDQSKNSPTLPEPYLQLGQSILSTCFGTDTGPWELYRYHYARKELRSVDYYLNKALSLRPSYADALKANKQLDSLYARYLQNAKLAFKNKDYEKARIQGERVLVLRPADARTAQLSNQLETVGFSPYPTPPPEIARYRR